MAKMVNETFADQKTGGENNQANLAFIFTMFAIYLLRTIYIVATYFKEQICEIIFFVPCFSYLMNFEVVI